MAYRVGRYQVHEPIASGGMAVVHLGRIVGPVGFSRTVAIKRLHPHLATDPEFVAMFLDEARLAARVQHPNVVATLDVVASNGQLFLVMDFVLGASFSQLLRSAREDGIVPTAAVTSAIVAGGLYGLHAAHEARDERGESLGIVHRDVSPQNLLVGLDGITRVVDFGVAKAASRGQATRDGQLKGKLSYMAPEQIRRRNVDRRADVYAAGVVLWEALSLQKLFQADDEGGVMAAVLEGAIPRLSDQRDGLPRGIDDVVARALARDPEARFPTAQDFAAALEAVIPPAPQREVGAWVARAGGNEIDERRGLVSEVEQSPTIESDADDRAVEGLVGHQLTEEEARKLATALTATLPSRAIPDPEAPDTSVSATDVAVRARSGRSTGLWASGVLAVLLLVGGASYVTARRDVANPSAAAASITAAAVAPSSSSSEGEPSATATSSSSDPSAVSPPAHHAARPVHKASPRASASARDPSCDPPFTVDLQGVKRFKSWCL
ncbi:MAG TPA: serine/threonine-protein kinase [Polyangiaceae bacterium]|nr:serine/threonine-protein kinase [Polyangiaceae bacterium]